MAVNANPANHKLANGNGNMRGETGSNDKGWEEKRSSESAPEKSQLRACMGVDRVLIYDACNDRGGTFSLKTFLDEGAP